MICPNQPLHCDAYSRLGSTGEPLTWYISQPAKWGPLTSQRSRLPSDVRTNAPLRVPTRTRTPLIPSSFLSFRRCLPGSISPTCSLEFYRASLTTSRTTSRNNRSSSPFGAVMTDSLHFGEYDR